MSEFVYDENGLQALISLIKKLCGNDLTNKKDIIKTKISNFATNKNIPDMDALLKKVSFESKLRQELLNLITINETYFYRELNQLNSVIYYANTMALSDNVKILCAPCSSGEEVYSLGMIAKTIGIDRQRLKIVGIDINSEVIQRCKDGIYNQRSIQNVSSNQKNMYFNKVDDMYQIKKELMPQMEFKVANIFDENLFKLGMFDIILSRNMMIYFDEEYRLMTIERFHKILKPFGRLYVGHADLVPYTDLYTKIVDIGSSYYEKL